MFGSIQQLTKWAFVNSIWFYRIKGHCCGDEILQMTSSRYDLERFGCQEVQSPELADLLIVDSYITSASKAFVLDSYHRMRSPKFVIAVGSCACSGGPFASEGEEAVRGASAILPVDVFIPGCPPRPEAILHGLIMLQEKMASGKSLGKN